MKTIILNAPSGQQDILKYGQSLFEKLQANREVVVYEAVEPDFSNIPELCDDTEKLVLFNPFACEGSFEALTKYLPQFKNIKYLFSPYSFYSGLDLQLLKKLGIRYRNNGGANARSVAQYAVTTMLMLLHKFPVLSGGTQAADGSVLGEEFHNKTVGIIGMGYVGKELTRILQGMGLSVVYYNRTPQEISAKLVSFENVLQQEVIFVTIATNPETMKQFSDFPARLQPHQYVIDITANEDLYSKKQLAEMVAGGKLAGYAVEVYDPSCFTVTPGSNCIKTPHIAWCTIDAEKRTIESYLQRALTILEGNADEVDFLV